MQAAFDIFFEDLFLHLVPHFDVLCLFYLDVSVRIKERDIHRAWHIAHAQGVYIAPRFSDSASPPLKQVSRVLGVGVHRAAPLCNAR